MKNWVSVLFVAAVLLFVNVGWTSAAAKPASPVPKVYLDGKALTAKVPPVLVKSSVLVPIRTIAESLGYKVGYDKLKKQVTVKEGATTIQMTLNQPKAMVNGRPVNIIASPILKSGTTLVPLRFVGETLGLGILWEHNSRSVFLSSNNANDNDDSDTGPDSTPTDGGLVGVVDGDGTDAGNLDGYIGTDPGQTDSENQEGNVGTSPDTAQAHLKQILYEQDSVVIQYDGVAVPSTNVIQGPDRIIIDLPHTDFAADFMAENNPSVPAPGQIVEFAVSGHEALQKFRFSQYETEPLAARIVLDLNQRWDFQISNNTVTGELRIQLKKPQPAQNPLPANKIYTVVLDAGHGGSDPGARSVTGRWEKEFNLLLAKKVQAILAKESRIKLVMTRQTDVYPSLDDRVNKANSLKADMFISIHGNSFTNGANGTETFYNRANSLALAKLMHKNILGATKFLDRGVRNQGYKVIKYTTMPAVLLEIGFLSHMQNATQMFDDGFQNRVAQAIATSVKQYFKLN